MGSMLPFRDVFEHLAQFGIPAEKRWSLVLRSKKGLTDNTQPGAQGRDQSYFEGYVIKYFSLYSVYVQSMFSVKKSRSH